MKDLCKKIERKKRELEDLIVLAVAKAQVHEHHPDFPKADKLRKCSEFLQKANHELFMATMCLMENRNAH